MFTLLITSRTYVHLHTATSFSFHPAACVANPPSHHHTLCSPGFCILLWLLFALVACPWGLLTHSPAQSLTRLQASFPPCTYPYASLPHALLSRSSAAPCVHLVFAAGFLSMVGVRPATLCSLVDDALDMHATGAALQLWPWLADPSDRVLGHPNLTLTLTISPATSRLCLSCVSPALLLPLLPSLACPA